MHAGNVQEFNFEFINPQKFLAVCKGTKRTSSIPNFTNHVCGPGLAGRKIPENSQKFPSHNYLLFFQYFPYWNIRNTQPNQVFRLIYNTFKCPKGLAITPTEYIYSSRQAVTFDKK